VTAGINIESLIRQPLHAIAHAFSTLPPELARVNPLNYPANSPVRRDWGIPGHFAKALRLENASTIDKRIPSLNEIDPQTLPNHSIVRFRCMVQDQHEQELYHGVYEVREPATKSKSLRTGKYSDIVTAGVSPTAVIDLENGLPFDRQPYFCISVPGEANWVHEVSILIPPLYACPPFITIACVEL
jgi:hypothetical protein